MALSFGTLQAQVQQLLGALGGRSFFGPVSASSGALAAGGFSTVTVAHNLGTADFYVMGEQGDAGNGFSIQWVARNKTSTSVEIAFRNVGGVAGAAMTLTFFLFGK